MAEAKPKSNLAQLEAITALLKTINGRLDLTEAALVEQIETHRGSFESIERYGQSAPNSAQLVANRTAAAGASVEPAPASTVSFKERYRPIVSTQRRAAR